MELRTEIEISATPSEVWQVLLERNRYHEWNPFVSEFAGDLSVGSRLDVTLSPPEGSELRLHPIVLAYEEGAALRWRGSLGHRWLLGGEHFFETVEVTPSLTRFIHGANLKGALLKLVPAQVTGLARGFVLMNQALKRRVESYDNRRARAADGR